MKKEPDGQDLGGGKRLELPAAWKGSPSPTGSSGLLAWSSWAGKLLFIPQAPMPTPAPQLPQGCGSLHLYPLCHKLWKCHFSEWTRRYSWK